MLCGAQLGQSIRDVPTHSPLTEHTAGVKIKYKIECSILNAKPSSSLNAFPASSTDKFSMQRNGETFKVQSTIAEQVRKGEFEAER